MQIKTIVLTKRIVPAPYEHEEFVITAELDEKDAPDEVMEELKILAHNALQYNVEKEAEEVAKEESSKAYVYDGEEEIKF